MRLVQKALTFDDVLLVPAHSAVLPRDVSLATRLSRNIRLNIPLVSAAMDTVTEARHAIALAQERGYESIAFPLIGAGSGGGNASRALAWMRDELDSIDFAGRVVIVRYRP